MGKVILFWFLGCLTLFAQPFQIGRTTLNLFDASRNRTIATEVFYPADTNGTDVPITVSSSQTFPLLSFGHGFVMTFEAYQNFWEELVPQGYIMAFPKTEGSITPSHTNFAKDLAFVIEAMNELNSNSSSLFFSRISPKNAVMGHSMGGGCALLAKQYSTQINHVVTFAAAETNPSAISASSTIDLPSFTIAGINDCVTPPATNQLPIYNTLQSSCKNYLGITGASHCQMANFNFFCSVGEGTCSPSPSITRTEQHQIIFSYLNLWLDYYLKENCVSGELFEALKTKDNDNVTNSNCLLCENLSLANLNNSFFEVSPNPFNESISIKSNNEVYFEYTLYDLKANKILEGRGISNLQLETSFLTSGIFFLTVIQNQQTKTVKLIKH
ncbi:T9SS type A sorting domain-containing protein [Flavobacterium piscinae]|uniref:T9SS type A sorting domain-containing protein n=1 Tax=Flavobacterium piscinae TaxID=2506424 RepID=A0A4Q1KX08_9FLAO|nr:T9SS type A sorting domain-containing protein [Flavobacterium piscinae]RXR34230.1 T9SS type A sorting domain-containing protein [Flavobacterium piscinae]